MRKPYTITKQRERWSDEEHKKFLEALKLYGRAWRRIEGIIDFEHPYLRQVCPTIFMAYLSMIYNNDRALSYYGLALAI